MNTDTISRLRALLAGYYAGETSESDERELHRLLGDASLPAEFEADRRMISANDSVKFEVVQSWLSR